MHLKLLNPPSRRSGSIKHIAKFLPLSLLVSLFTGTMLAQSQHIVQDFEAAIRGKQNELKNYSADATARYAWVDGHLVGEAVHVHAFAVFIAESVTIKDGKIEIKGDRAILVRRETGKLAMRAEKSPMTLIIDLRGANPGIVLSELTSSIFFHDLPAALDGLPDRVKDLIPYSVGFSPPRCGCAWIQEGEQWIKLDAKDKALRSIVPVSMSNPKLDKQIAKELVLGKTTLVFEVQQTGRVGQIWLANPIGHGMDDQPIMSLLTWRFKPETYDGKPVGNIMQVEIGFELY